MKINRKNAMKDIAMNRNEMNVEMNKMKNTERKSKISYLGRATVWSIASIFSVSTALINSASADVTPFRVALVDMNRAIQTVDLGKKAKSDLQKEISAKEKEVTNEEAAIRKMMEEFQKQASVMNEEARAKKQQEIQEKVMKHQEKRMRYQNEMQKREADLTKPIVDKLRKIISDLSKQKGYQMVLEKNDSVVLFSHDSDDLTEELISNFNKSK